MRGPTFMWEDLASVDHMIRSRRLRYKHLSMGTFGSWDHGVGFPTVTLATRFNFAFDASSAILGEKGLPGYLECSAIPLQVLFRKGWSYVQAVGDYDGCGPYIMSLGASGHSDPAVFLWLETFNTCRPHPPHAGEKGPDHRLHNRTGQSHRLGQLLAVWFPMVRFSKTNRIYIYI